MKYIVWIRIGDRLIHGQIMTQQIQHTEANEVPIIDDGITKDSFPQMIMKFSVPDKVSLKVLNVKDVIKYLNESGKHERIVIPVKTPAMSDELNDAGVRLKGINVGGTGTRAGRKPMFKNVSINEEEKEAFRSLLNKEINVLPRVIVTGPEEDIAKYLQKGNGIPMHIRSSQAVYRRQQDE